MGKKKSERHHWWPECVSARWADAKGGVHWLLPTGEVRRARPASFGVIGNGHLIKLASSPEEETPWDQNFEKDFQKADTCFPSVIDWLESLQFEPKIGQPRRSRFMPQASSTELFGQLVECLTSLAIRSPMTRQACVSLAERLRGPLPERKRNTLIAMNMRNMHQRAVANLGARGKATVIHSPDREFVFGDGFFHNLTSPSSEPIFPRMLVPLTPALAVLYAFPLQYTPEPRLSTLVIGADECDALNRVLQIYARDKLFYRADKPDVCDEYRLSEHRSFAAPGHVVDEMIHDMPGVPSRNAAFDFLGHFGRR